MIRTTSLPRWRAPRRLVAVLAMVATLAGLLVLGPAPAASAADPVLRSRVSGEQTLADGTDVFTTVSRDGGQTWQPAKVAGHWGSHPWDGNSYGLPASAQWINCTSSFFTCIDETVLYRTRVQLADSGPLSLKFRVVADNAATPFINGVKAGDKFYTSGTVDIDASLLRHGENIFDMEFVDEGGWAGFRYELYGTLGDQKPTITTAANVVAEATGPNGATVHFTKPQGNDAEDGVLASTCAPASGTQFALGATTVTCVVSDSSLQTASSTFTVTVRDTTAPVVSTLSNLTVEATGPSGSVVTFASAASDTVSGNLPTTCTPASGTSFPIGTRFVSCRATDGAGNVGVRSFSVVVRDTTAPVLVLPAPIVKEATGFATSVTYTATAVDLVDGARPVSCTWGSGTSYAIGTYTQSCSAADVRNNQTTGSFTISIVDTTAPIVNVPSTLVLEATGPAGALAAYSVSAFDMASGSRPVSCSSGGLFPIGTTPVLCQASDPSGNVGQATFHVTVRDTTAPSVGISVAGTSLEGDTRGGAHVHYTSAASDAVSGAIAPACSQPTGAVFPVGTTELSCSAADSSGNIGRSSVLVVVRDTTSPVLILPGGLLAEAVGPLGAPVAYSVSALDVVDGPTEVACSRASDEVFAVGSTLVACSTVDVAGNRSSGAFPIHVVDTTAPVLDLPSRLVFEATNGGGAAVHIPGTATDVVSGDLPVECDIAPGAQLPLGDWQVGCWTTDAAGNRAAAIVDVVVQDTTAPTVQAVPADLAREGDTLGGAHVSWDLALDDAVTPNGALVTSCSIESGSLFQVGATPVTCAATDQAGNTGTTSFTVLVSDTTAPVLVLSGDSVHEATGAEGTQVEYSATASDIVDGPLVPVCTAASGSVFALGSTTVGCSVQDVAGNAADGVFDVTVQDTTAPVVTVPAAITLEATGPGGAVVSFGATASDAVDGAPGVVCSVTSGDEVRIGTTVVGCTSTDAAGNIGGASFTVTVVDTTAPELTVPAGITAEATGPAGAVVSYAVSAADVADAGVDIDCSKASGTTFPITGTSVVCVATDDAGNSTTRTFTVTVEDTTKPVVTFAGNQGTYGVDDTVAITCAVTDAVTSLICAGVSGAAWSFGVGDESVTRTATDVAGNTGSGTVAFRVVVVRDDLCALTTRFVPEKGLANSLCVKLRAGSFGAYRNELRAQSGKKISAANATLLSNLSLSLG